MYTASKGCCETALTRRLAGAFARCLCDKYPFLVCWPIYDRYPYLLRGIDTLDSYFAISAKRDKFFNIMFASLLANPLLKRGLLYIKKRIFFLVGAYHFLIEYTLFRLEQQQFNTELSPLDVC